MKISYVQKYQGQLEGETDMAEKKNKKTPSKAEGLMNEAFELNLDSLDKVAGGCDDTYHPHNWELIGREEGKCWGYNLRYRCTNCGEEKTEWEKYPWEDARDWINGD